MRKHALPLAIAAAAGLTSMSEKALAESDEESPLPALEAAAAPVAAPADGLPTICLAGDYDGVSHASARTAFGVICDALRKAGAPVGGVSEAPGQATSAYRMELQRLDRVIILRVTYEAPVGSPRDSRSLTLNNLDEVLIAAGRVSEALVQGKSIDETANVDTLVGTETRQYQKKSGETFFGFGLSGFAVPAVGVYAGAGFELPAYYETPSLALGGSLRVSLTGGGENDGNRATFGSLSLGGRAFLTEGDVSPFVGGGVGFDWLSLQKGSGSDYFHGTGEGFGAYAEAGVEMLRLHRTRFVVGLRVDAPFFATKTTNNPPWVDGSRPAPEVRSQYAIPITLNVTFMPFKL